MNIIRYYRVSTAKQGVSGLGLEAQEEAVNRFCQYRNCNTLGTYTEVETGKSNDRPELLKALHHAKITNSTLIVAKLDRLSRNLAFIAALQESKVKFICCDNPEANEMTIGVLAVFAQHEAKMISTRTKEALAAAKARGVRLGNPNGAAPLHRSENGNAKAMKVIKDRADRFAHDLEDVINDIIDRGHTTHRAIAEELNNREIKSARGGKWHGASVRQLLMRLGKN